MGLGKFLRVNTFDAERAVTSYLYGPWILMGTRAFGTVYLVAVLVGALATTPSFRYFITFFTNISFCALVVYLMWSLIWSIQYCRLSEEERTQWAKRGSRVWGAIYWILYGSLAVYHIIVPLVFWSILRRYQTPHYGVYEWATVSEHSVDGVLMILEIISARMQMDIRHLPFTLLFMLLYLLTAYVHYWTTGIWVYPFLDKTKYGWVTTALFCVGVAFALVLVYLIMWKLHNVKESLGVKRRRRKEVVLGQDQDQEQEQEVSVSTASATTTTMPEKEDKEVELQSVHVQLDHEQK